MSNFVSHFFRWGTSNQEQDKKEEKPKEKPNRLRVKLEERKKLLEVGEDE